MDIHRLPYHEDSTPFFLQLLTLPNTVWLDSGRQNASDSRFDILTAQPIKILCNPSINEIESEVAALIKPNQQAQLDDRQIPFWGGAIGYLNYEYNHHKFGLEKAPDSHNQHKNSYVGIYAWALIQDHQLRQAHLVCLPQIDPATQHQLATLFNQALSAIPDNRWDNASTSSHHKPNNLQPAMAHVDADLNATDYKRSIARIQEYIVNGDAYQVNFAQRFSGDFRGDAAHVYLRLRQLMPCPFSAYIDLGEDKILSFSPERFIAVNGHKAHTKPIKGTAARRPDTREDDKQALTLKKSSKNRAENLMIVDLLRNDFNRYCQPFSVKTPALFALESYINVHHLVSTVEGELQPNITALQFMANCFPGGSITGAPKKRAMEIIDELESSPRNIYCGSIFYLSSHGALDSNIAIRTLLIDNKNVYCWGGGGIVADSTSESEYQESFDKVQRLLDGLNNHA